MTRMTPKLALPLQPSAPHQREDIWPLGMIERATDPIHSGSSGESGFEPGTLRPRSRNLTTGYPRVFSLVANSPSIGDILNCNFGNINNSRHLMLTLFILI
ncbi:hypothetical protein AVEN_195683-1 [Araneus ventricosus]|uniref:Uncharacterized protein n=1 Tax=Araneus ventricosus TaxID=182803 RepID=A0A4Y2B9K3_ARAVE|nr:hypothetical protein AVEN_195683-1 [Araneus ventricosus]